MKTKANNMQKRKTDNVLTTVDRLNAAFAEIKEHGQIALCDLNDGGASTCRDVSAAFKSIRGRAKPDGFIFYTKKSMSDAQRHDILRCVFGATKTWNNHKGVFYYLFGVLTQHGLKVDRRGDWFDWHHNTDLASGKVSICGAAEAVYLSGFKNTNRRANKEA